jgi:ABC-type lipoprotein release transport system permease subunit
MQLLESLRLLALVALRNLWLYRLKTVVTAALLLLGAFLAVLGSSLLADVEASMRESVIESVTGHLQVYSKKAKDELAMFGGSFMGRSDVGTLEDVAPVSRVASANPNVAAVVPMGLDMAILARGNEADQQLDALRAAAKSGDPALLAARKSETRFLLTQLDREMRSREKLAGSARRVELARQAEDLAKAATPGFLDDLSESTLQFLETRIAPISGEKNVIYLSYLGVDMELYRANFAKFKVVEGEALPPGQRGILLGRKVREDYLKLLVARLFDRLQTRTQRRGTPIKGDAENERDAADLPRQYQTIIALLSPQAARELARELDELGIEAPPGEGDAALLEGLATQLKRFLTVDDANFVERHAWFYAHVAPKIRLYEISPGETIVLRSYTRSGYLQSLPVKVYGVYTFEGLEDSDLAGAVNIIDLVSFRQLYGQMTDAVREELAAMRKAANVAAVDESQAEEALFGAGATTQLEQRTTEPSAAAAGGATPVLTIKPTIPAAFAPAETRSGLALSAAIKLKDAAKIAETKAELERAFAAAGLDVQVIDWQKASGIIGQFVNIMRLVLVFALAVIFIAALAIINNTIIIATFDRVREIGTMRAIGAPRGFVAGLFLAETALTALLGACLGGALAAAALGVMHVKGLPANSGVVAFLFSGPRLFPRLRPATIVLLPLAVALVATVVSLYAARHAARISPIEAMSEKE